MHARWPLAHVHVCPIRVQGSISCVPVAVFAVCAWFSLMRARVFDMRAHAWISLLRARACDLSHVEVWLSRAPTERDSFVYVCSSLR